MPGVKFDIVHITARRNTLVEKIGLGVGSNKLMKRLYGVILMPFSPTTTVVSPRPYPDAADPFRLAFPLRDGTFSVTAHYDRFPPDVICLENEIFSGNIADTCRDAFDRFRQTYVFSLSAVRLIKATMDIPYPVISCHGVETGLIPYILRSDRAFDGARILFTAHHSEIKDKGKLIFHVDLGLFPKICFEGTAGFKRLLAQEGLFYDERISLLKMGLAFADHGILLKEEVKQILLGDKPPPSNFYYRLDNAGRLSVALSGGESGRDRPKVIVAHQEKTLSELEPFNLAVSSSRGAIDDVRLGVLSHVSLGVNGGYANKLNELLKMRGALPKNFTLAPKPAHLPRGSGSAIIHMLSLAASLKDCDKCLIHLNVGSEKLLLGNARISPVEIALRQAGNALAQLPASGVGWTLIEGNTTFHLPSEKFRSGAVILSKIDLGLVIFAHPVDIRTETAENVEKYSKRWGAIFVKIRGGDVWSIREKPPISAIEDGVAQSGGSEFYANLSRYAIRDDVRKLILLRFYFQKEGELSLPLGTKYALHFIKHIIEPMLSEGVEWMDRREREGWDEEGKRIDSTDWETIYRCAQEIRGVAGGVAIASSSGILYDLRGDESGERGRQGLADVISDMMVNASVIPVKEFFELPYEIRPHKAAQVLEKAGEAAPSRIEEIFEQNDLFLSDPFVAEAASELRGKISTMTERELATAVRMIKFAKLMRDSIGSETDILLLPHMKDITAVRRAVASKIGDLMETEIADVVRTLKFDLVQKIMPQDRIALSKVLLSYLPMGEIDRSAVSRLIGIINAVDAKVGRDSVLSLSGIKALPPGKGHASNIALFDSLVDRSLFDLSDRFVRELLAEYLPLVKAANEMGIVRFVKDMRIRYFIHRSFGDLNDPYIRSCFPLIERSITGIGRRLDEMSFAELDNHLRNLKITVVRIIEDWGSPQFVAAMLSAIPMGILDGLDVRGIVTLTKKMESLVERLFNARENNVQKSQEGSVGDQYVIVEDGDAHLASFKAKFPKTGNASGIDNEWGIMGRDFVISGARVEREEAGPSLVMNFSRRRSAVEGADDPKETRIEDLAKSYWGFKWLHAFIAVYQLDRKALDDGYTELF